MPYMLELVLLRGTPSPYLVISEKRDINLFEVKYMLVAPAKVKLSERTMQTCTRVPYFLLLFDLKILYIDRNPYIIIKL